MNTTVDELKALYVELGGSAADVVDIVTIPDMIAALANVAGSTIELPAVSASDNGDVLTVVNGKWAKADIPAELPAVTAADNGKILAVNASGKWDKANAPESEVVNYVCADTGSSGLPKTGRELTKPASFATTAAFITQVVNDLNAGKVVSISIGSESTNVYNNSSKGRCYFSLAGTGVLYFTSAVFYAGGSVANITEIKLDAMSGTITGYGVSFALN